jgi:hypothetical protein
MPIAVLLPDLAGMTHSQTLVYAHPLRGQGTDNGHKR